MKTMFSCVKQEGRFPFFGFTLLFISLYTSSITVAQSTPNCVCAYCGYACGSGHASSCKYASNTTTNTTGNTYSFANRLQAYKATRQKQKLANALAANEKGIEEYNKKNWVAAIKYFKKAVKNDPDNEVMKNNLKNAEDAYAVEQKNKKISDDIETGLRKHKESQDKKEEEQKKKDREREQQQALQKKKEADQQQALQKNEQEAMALNLKLAQQKIFSLQKDISRIQQSLKVYSKSLQNNSSEFEKWGSTVDQAFNEVIDNSKDYLANMFLKYNLLGGLKAEEQKIVFNKLHDILGSSNPKLQEWLINVSKSKLVDLDEVEDIIDRVNLSGDLAVLFTGDRNTVKHNMDALLLVNGLIETFNLAGYKDYIKDISKPFGFNNMPGDYFEQAKIIGETYADLSSICYSWFMINKLTTDNESFAKEINHLSLNMQYEMKEIDCLKKCMKDYTPGCVQKCTGVTRFSTPPPLLR